MSLTQYQDRQLEEYLNSPEDISEEDHAIAMEEERDGLFWKWLDEFKSCHGRAPSYEECKASGVW